MATMGTTAGKHLPPEARPAAAIKRTFVESATTIKKVLTALAVLVANVSCEEYFFAASGSRLEKKHLKMSRALP
jgi:hypothetical protein